MRRSSLWAFLNHVLRHPYALLPGAPRGIINSARDWVIERRLEVPVDIRRGPAAEFWEIDPPELRSLAPPNSVEVAPTTNAPRIFPTPGTALFFLKGARVLGTDGVVISPDNRVFTEFTYVDESGGVDHHSVFRRRRFPRPRPLAGWYATLCYPSSFAYFHWIVESLPRLRLLQPHLHALDGVFVPAKLEPAMRESLLAMGVREDQLVPLDMASHYQPEHLLVPNYCAGVDVPEWVPRFLRSAILIPDAPQVARGRLFISRSDAAKRRLLNEDELWPLLAVRGFEKVRLRDLSFDAQVALFDAAQIVIGPHGAGLANVAFCRPGTKVLELLPSPKVVPHVFFSLTSAAGGQYWYLHGRISPGSDASDDVHKDFSVDPGRLLDQLNLMEAG